MIAEAFEDDTGRYTCVASNSLGADNTSAEVYIEGQMFSHQEIVLFLPLRQPLLSSAFVFVQLQELRHRTQKEKDLCQSPDQEPCLSMCFSMTSCDPMTQ